VNSDSALLPRSLWALNCWWRGSGAVATAALAGIATLIAAVWAGHSAVQARATRAGLAVQLAALRAEASAAGTVASPPAADFTAELPATVSPAAALEVIQGAAARLAVRVESVQVQEVSASPERLGRAELAITARAGYADLKRWLAEMTERLPASTVSRLQMQLVEGTAQVEARLTLVVWSRPATTAELVRR
jgi:hypothetical protein